ncbi:MAG TPA: DivIVA domain-containing protein, partial [Natronincola sp.]|nr:DivIVA domain-containing protein [Natronincola sp.]
MLKPMDIHNVNFKRVFKGYCPDQVDDYLATIVGKYETLYQQNRKLQEELNSVREELGSQDQGQDVSNLISLTKETVKELQTVAQQESENMVNAAQVKADHLVSEAKLKAERLLADAENRLAKTQWAERQLRQKMRSTMESIWSSLNEEEASEEESFDDDLESTKVYSEIRATIDHGGIQATEIDQPMEGSRLSEGKAERTEDTAKEEYDPNRLETKLDFGFKDFDLTSE